MRPERRKRELVSAYFREGPGREARSVIDDRTWSDLDMDDVLAAVDRTRSSVGQACLYALLRTPLSDPAALAQRAARIGALGEDAAGRARVAGILRRLGVQRDSELFAFLAFLKTQISDRRLVLFRCLSALAVVAIPGAVILGVPGILLLAIVVVVNLVIHYRFKPVVSVESPSYEYLHRLLVAAGRLGRLSVKGIEAECAELRDLAASMRRLRRRTAFLLTPSGVSGDILALLLEYVRQVFLQEVTTYFAAHNEIVRRGPEIARLYGLVGTVDAFAGLAALRRERPECTVPRFDDSALLVEAEDLVHPLLDRAVPNSIRMDGRGIVVTGSNMSGKSTFLRTLGVNMLLATTACLVFARRMRASPLLTLSSITNRDSLLDAESHYIVEARRLLALLAACRGERPALVVIDEILSGTNSEERIAASIRILRHFARLRCLVVAATHDRPIAQALAADYDNAHFTHRVDADGLEFDYRLREGIVEAGNAFRLLQLLGYPAEILGDPSGAGEA
jgi:hypothetical protein